MNFCCILTTFSDKNQTRNVNCESKRHKRKVLIEFLHSKSMQICKQFIFLNIKYQFMQIRLAQRKSLFLCRTNDKGLSNVTASHLHNFLRVKTYSRISTALQDTLLITYSALNPFRLLQRSRFERLRSVLYSNAAAFCRHFNFSTVNNPASYF